MKLITLLLIMTAQAFSMNLEYPELLVSPRATKRIVLEQKRETSDSWKMYFPMQLSSLTTLITGVTLFSDVDEDKDKKSISPLVTTLIGGSWLAATLYMSTKYRPYRRAIVNIKSLPYKTKNQQLTKERMAEEEINHLGRIAKRLKWISVISNFTTSIYAASQAKDDSDTKILGGLSALLAFTPLLWEMRWETVSNEQEKYKKRIYGPIKFSHVMFNPFSQRLSTGFVANYSF